MTLKAHATRQSTTSFLISNPHGRNVAATPRLRRFFPAHHPSIAEMLNRTPANLQLTTPETWSGTLSFPEVPGKEPSVAFALIPAANPEELRLAAALDEEEEEEDPDDDDELDDDDEEDLEDDEDLDDEDEDVDDEDDEEEDDGVIDDEEDDLDEDEEDEDE